MRFASRVGLALALWCVGCGDDVMMEPDGSAACGTDSDCDDGLFCNGEERCDPASAGAGADGCVEGEPPPCGGPGMCDEATMSCTGGCDDPDADGDGVDSIACGGMDCDDTNDDIYPGNTEVCDAEGVDEDCDPTTLGGRDEDDDGVIDQACCNGDECGLDCDDSERNVNPSTSETCDGLDNDCDTMVDEGQQVPFYPDVDGDGFGEEGATSMLGCVSMPPADMVTNDDDCDDTDVQVQPGATELCDSVDNDCDGMVDEGSSRTFWADEDDDGFGDVDRPMTTTECEPPTGFAGNALDCDDGDDTIYPGADDPCDNLDNDCRTDGGFEPEDVDEDDHAAIGADCDGLPADDCDDDEAASYPDAPELCDGEDNDCSSGGGPIASEDMDGDGHVLPGTACSGGPFPKDDCNDTDGVLCSPVQACVEMRCAARVSLGSGTTHTCTLEGAGGLSCWGNLALGYSATPTSVSGLSTVVQVTAGDLHTCVLLADGEVQCWGSDDDGRVGNGAATGFVVAPTSTGLMDAVHVDAGLTHTCAVRASGAVQCWGDGQSGKLGVSGDQDSPTTVPGISNAVWVAAGVDHSCAVDGAGAVWCWGNNAAGQLGDAGGLGASMTPVQVAGVADAVQVTAGNQFTCALLSAGGIRCWGEGSQGQLGHTMFADSRDPVSVQDRAGVVTDAAAVVAGWRHACALRAGAAHCWGDAGSGRLGNGETTGMVAEATGVTGFGSGEYLSAGLAHSCARTSSDQVLCWGQDSMGQLGQGSTGPSQPLPASVGTF